MGATPDLRGPSLADGGRSRNLAGVSASLHLHPRRDRRAPRSRARPRTRELGPDRRQETPRVGAVRSHHHDSDTRFCATTVSRHVSACLPTGLQRATTDEVASGRPAIRLSVPSTPLRTGDLLIAREGREAKGRNDRMGDRCLHVRSTRTSAAGLHRRRPASCDDETGVPTGRSTSGWRLELVGVHSSTHKQPRDQRVGVPHIASVQLVSAPHGGWDGRHQIEDPLRGSEVVRDADRARYRLARIGDRASAPSADLVAKQSEPSGPCCPDRSLGNDATLSSPLVPNGRGLDDEAAGGDVDLQGGMVESAARATLHEGFDRLVDLPIQSDHLAARAQRNPVEVDCPGRERGRHPCSLQMGQRNAGSATAPFVVGVEENLDLARP